MWPELIALAGSFLLNKLGGGSDVQNQNKKLLSDAYNWEQYGFGQRQKQDALLNPLREQQAGRMSQALDNMTYFSPTEYMNTLMGDTRNTFENPGAQAPSLTTAPSRLDVSLPQMEDYSTTRDFMHRREVTDNTGGGGSGGTSTRPLGGGGGGTGRTADRTGGGGTTTGGGSGRTVGRTGGGGGRTVRRTSGAAPGTIGDIQDDPDRDVRRKGEGEGRRYRSGTETNDPIYRDIPGATFNWAPMRSRRDIMDLGNRLNTATNRAPVSFNAPQSKAPGMASGLSGATNPMMSLLAEYFSRKNNAGQGG